jgi:hypothetical protein
MTVDLETEHHISQSCRKGEKAIRQRTSPILNDGIFNANGCFWMNSLVSLYALLVAEMEK